MIRLSTVEEIEEHLVGLGGGNHADNMREIRNGPYHYLLSLTEEEFGGLVFLQCSAVSRIVPMGSDRRLMAVARRARELPPSEMNLAPNWDIAEANSRFKKAYNYEPEFRLPTLLVRDTRGAERGWAADGW